ncbi:hypothetical protein GPECTOR_4g834 [Gonium pectorale]|uniref:Uncharacterized protein n=1 Tax=Gonium pectorale TaxID=33097 RepID=A0A150GY95_GONPE|nr:hypothetical protein GPECTOR_4g834 [Gonium pectorale]|eukprot:KXZ54764.1 hypothetical protein GPECTOR_4g834 [Gonium pectorale]
MASDGRCGWAELPPGIIAQVASCLPCNEVTCNIRLVNKATAAQLNGPEHTVIRLSQPVPQHAFAAYWLAPGATRGLNLQRRQQLLCLAAASGVVPNLEVAVAAAGCVPTYQVFAAAAASGHLDPCQWLHVYGCPLERDSDEGPNDTVLAAAAGAGHLHICEWLVTLGGAWGRDYVAHAVRAAARGGYPDLAGWLLQHFGERARLIPAHVQTSILVGTARGCDLVSLQQRVQREGWGASPERAREDVMAAAAGSPTPDWAAKVEWLEAQGCPRTSVWVAPEAAARPDGADALARLTWLRGRGYAMNGLAVDAAARAGHEAALRFLLTAAPASHVNPGSIVYWICNGGHLAALRMLVDRGWAIDVRGSFLTLARGGHQHALTWLAETLANAAAGATAVEALQDTYLFAEAAASGNVEMLAWLRERGCPWDASAFGRAVESGCEVALEWLAERGCPMPPEVSHGIAFPAAPPPTLSESGWSPETMGP